MWKKTLGIAGAKFWVNRQTWHKKDAKYCVSTDEHRANRWIRHYSTVTDLARLRGWSTLQPRSTAI